MGYKGREMSLAATKFVLGDVNTEPEKEALRYQIGALGSIDDTNTTYTHSLSGTDLILSGSDATTDVVDLSGLGGGGNPFDQDLNTTNFPTFGTLNLTGETLAMNGINTLRIPDQGSLEYHGSLYVGGGGTSASNSSGFQGQYNTGVGIDSLKSVTTGWSNLGLGTFSLENLITGIENNASGSHALRNITTADFNTASGSHALRHITTTDGNTALGYYAGRYIGGGAVSNTISSNSLYLGRETKALVDGGNNEIVIGYDVTGNGSNTITLGNAAITNTYLKGAVDTASLGVTGVLNAGAATITGLVSSDTATVTGLLTSGSATVTGLLSVKQVVVDGSNIASSAAIAWNAATNAQPDLTLAHNTMITVANLPLRGQASLSGIVGGAGSYTLDIEHAGLTVEVMGGLLADIAALAVGGKFEISIKRNLTELRVWISTKA